MDEEELRRRARRVKPQSPTTTGSPLGEQPDAESPPPSELQRDPPGEEHTGDETTDGNGIEADLDRDFVEALNPELIAALDRLAHCDIISLHAALEAVREAAGDSAMLRESARLSAFNGLRFRLKSIREARRAVDAVFGAAPKERRQKTERTPPPHAPPPPSHFGTLAPLEPVDHPVSGTMLLTEIANLFRTHVAFPLACLPDLLAVWVLHTYVFDRFRHTPYLHVTSPTWECGKSLVLDLLEVTTRAGLQAVTTTPPTIFRLIEAHSPTLIFDDVDSWLTVRGADPELRAILHAGYEATKHTWRLEQDPKTGKWTPVPFKTFGPKVLGGIGALPRVLASRSIAVHMRRKLASDVRDRLTGDVRDACVLLRRKALRWAADSSDAITSTDPRTAQLPAEFGNRQRDIWEPLAVVAVVAGGDAWAGQLSDAASDLTKTTRPAADDLGVRLLRDMQTIMTERNVPDMPTPLLRQYLCEMRTADDTPTPWATMNPHGREGEGRWITYEKMAALAEPFNVGPEQWRDRDTKKNCRGWVRASIAAALLPYPLPDVDEQDGEGGGDE